MTFQMLTWKGEKTTSLVYFESDGGAKTRLNISFESPVLSEKIWGKPKS